MIVYGASKGECGGLRPYGRTPLAPDWKKKRPERLPPSRSDSTIMVPTILQGELYHMSEKKSRTKKRNWAFVLYPESMPENWKDLIIQSGLQAVVSPLHDSDINDTGEVKKPHYHIILIYSGPTSYNVVSSFTESLNGTVPQALESVRGYYRYLTHKDNPEKAQYDERDIIALNGFDISDYIELTKSEVLGIKKRLQELIRNKGFVEYAVFMDFLLDNDLSTEYDVASSNTYFFEKYLSSRRHSGYCSNVNPVTGEVLHDE